MKELKQKISITLDPSVIEKLRLLEEIEDRSLSQYINLVLKKHIEDTEK